MVFVFLPLMALVRLALYHSPARGYVELLVFLLHLQSALFLAMILQILQSRLAQAVPSLGASGTFGNAVLFCYGFWYFYAALHRYYGQDRTRTAAKFAVLIGADLVCLRLSLGGTVVLSALLT